MLPLGLFVEQSYIEKTSHRLVLTTINGVVSVRGTIGLSVNVRTRRSSLKEVCTLQTSLLCAQDSSTTIPIKRTKYILLKIRSKEIRVTLIQCIDVSLLKNSRETLSTSRRRDTGKFTNRLIPTLISDHNGLLFSK